MTRSALVACTSLLACCALAAPAGAATTTPWRALPDVANLPFGAAPGALAVGDDGTVAVAYSGASAPTVAVRRAGGPFTSEDLPAGVPAGTPVELTVDPDGAVFAAWLAGTEVRVSRLAPGGHFAAPTTLSSDATGIADVAALPDGRAVVAWRSAAGRVRVALRAADGTWGAAHDVSDADETVTVLGSDALTVGHDGRLALSWLSARVPSPPAAPLPHMLVRVAVLDPGAADVGAPSTAADTVTGSFTAPKVAVGDDGGLDVAVGSSTAPFVPPSSLTISTRLAGTSAWTIAPAVATVPPGPFGTTPIALAAGPHGTTVAYLSSAPPTVAVRTRRRALGTTTFADGPVLWSSPGALLGSFDIAGLPDGRTAFMTSDLSATTAGITDDGAPLTDALGGASGPFAGLRMGQSPAGMVAGVWPGAPGLNLIAPLHAALLDGAAPRLTDVRVPAHVTAGTPAALGASARDASGDPDVTWDLGDGRTATGAAPSATWQTPGTYTVGVRATDAFANTARVTRTVVVDPAAAPAPAPALPTPARGVAQSHTDLADRTAPVLSGLRLSRTTFRAGPGATALSAAVRRTPAGTELTYRLSEPARVAIAVERSSRGFRKGKACVAKRPAGAAGRRAKRCALVTVSGVVRRSARAGASTLAFTGRLGRRALAPGRYRFALTAVDASGNASAPQRLAFRIVKR